MEFGYRPPLRMYRWAVQDKRWKQVGCSKYIFVLFCRLIGAILSFDLLMQIRLSLQMATFMCANSFLVVSGSGV